MTDRAIAAFYSLPAFITGSVGASEPTNTKVEGASASPMKALRVLWDSFCLGVKRFFSFSKTPAGPAAATVAAASSVLPPPRISQLIENLRTEGAITSFQQLVAELKGDMSLVQQITHEGAEVIIQAFPSAAAGITPRDAQIITAVLSTQFASEHGRPMRQEASCAALDPLSLLATGEIAFQAFAACSIEDFQALSEAYAALFLKIPDVSGNKSEAFLLLIKSILDPSKELSQSEQDILAKIPSEEMSTFTQFINAHSRVLHALYLYGELKHSTRIPAFCIRWTQDSCQSLRSLSAADRLSHAITVFISVYQQEQAKAPIITAIVDETLKPLIDQGQQKASQIADPKERVKYQTKYDNLLRRQREELIRYYESMSSQDLEKITPHVLAPYEVEQMDLLARADLNYPWNDPYA